MGFVKYSLIFAACLAVLAVAVHGADTKHCVQCMDKNCSDPVNINNTGVSTCELKDNEECIRYSYNVTGRVFTVRGCFPDSTKCSNLKENYSNLTSDNSTWKCYTCTSDLCNQDNSATSLGVSVVALVAGAIIGLYYK